MNESIVPLLIASANAAVPRLTESLPRQPQTTRVLVRETVAFLLARVSLPTLGLAIKQQKAVHCTPNTTLTPIVYCPRTYTC